MVEPIGLALELVADCKSLQVGIACIDAGRTQRFGPASCSMAMIVHRGQGWVDLPASRREIAVGGVEILCPGESCTISAATALQVYVVVTKDKKAA